jgi:hypothetical protein
MLRSSVSRRISYHLEIYWAVRKCQIHNKRELSDISSSILNSVLLLIAVNYFNMKRQETKLQGLSKCRFDSIIFLFRMAGFQFKMKEVSTIYAIYMVTATICSCSTFIGMFVAVYMYRNDLGRAMSSMRVLIPITNVIWIFSYCR